MSRKLAQRGDRYLSLQATRVANRIHRAMALERYTSFVSGQGGRKILEGHCVSWHLGNPAVSFQIIARTLREIPILQEQHFMSRPHHLSDHCFCPALRKAAHSHAGFKKLNAGDPEHKLVTTAFAATAYAGLHHLGNAAAGYFGRFEVIGRGVALRYIAVRVSKSRKRRTGRLQRVPRKDGLKPQESL